MGAKRIEDLVVFQLADELRQKVHARSATHPAKHDRRFCDQFQDAASSAARNITEGFGRYGHREFAQFLTIARGSVFEVQDLLRDGAVRGYWRASDVLADIPGEDFDLVNGDLEILLNAQQRAKLKNSL